jgi:hypothetical protein
LEQHGDGELAHWHGHLYDRLFETKAALPVDGDAIALSSWSTSLEMLVPDGVDYVRNMEGGGAIGTIKAFVILPYFAIRPMAPPMSFLLRLSRNRLPSGTAQSAWRAAHPRPDGISCHP